MSTCTCEATQQCQQCGTRRSAPHRPSFDGASSFSRSIRSGKSPAVRASPAPTVLYIVTDELTKAAQSRGNKKAYSAWIGGKVTRPKGTLVIVRPYSRELCSDGKVRAPAVRLVGVLVFLHVCVVQPRDEERFCWRSTTIVIPQGWTPKYTKIDIIVYRS
jgi:hypothetical protein